MAALTPRAGPEMLNGPILEGFSALMGAGDMQVLVTAATRRDLRLVLESIASGTDLVAVGAANGSHTRTAQPPWYQNETREDDLTSLLQPRQARRRASLRE